MTTFLLRTSVTHPVSRQSTDVQFRVDPLTLDAPKMQRFRTALLALMSDLETTAALVPPEPVVPDL